ncbi:Ran-binding protein 9 [Yarrowia sp. B02]|nr:Ran-binding protein 9 [Yarrowia sp. B02]
MTDAKPHNPKWIPEYLLETAFSERYGYTEDDVTQDTSSSGELSFLRGWNGPSKKDLATTATHTNKNAESASPSPVSSANMLELHQQQDHKPISLPKLPTMWIPAVDSINCIRDDLEIDTEREDDGGSDQNVVYKSDAPIPRGCGVYYYEVEILAASKDSAVCMGFCKTSAPLSKPPGFETESWGYHSDYGNVMCCQGTSKDYGSSFNQPGDVVGCCINFKKREAFFTKNGMPLSKAFSDLPSDPLYPAIGVKKKGPNSSGARIRANFGGSGPFVFDIKQYVLKQKHETQRRIESSTKVPAHAARNAFQEKQLAQGNLNPLINNLVMSYLTHVGYVDTAEALYQDVLRDQDMREEGTGGDVSMEPPSDEGLKSLASYLSPDITVRHKIRGLILSGDIDGAMALVEEHYPSVFESQDMVLFQLKCRKFVELLQANEVIEAVEYGRELKMEYSNDPRPQVQDLLRHAFSLIAYDSNQVNEELDTVKSREELWEQLSSAILVAHGRSPVAPLKRIVQHTRQMIKVLGESGNDTASFLNVTRDFM